MTFPSLDGHQTNQFGTKYMEINDQLLLESIKSGDPRKRDWALYQFYADGSIQQWARDYIQRNGGSPQDVEDVFQEAIMVFDRNIRQDRFEGKSTLKTYLISIIKWGWVSYRRKKDNTTELVPENWNGSVESVEAQYFSKEKKDLLEQAIQALDERCQQLLRYYKLDYSMKEIQSLLGFKNPDMAKKQSYRCRERLRKVFLKNPALLKALNITIENA